MPSSELNVSGLSQTDDGLTGENISEIEPLSLLVDTKKDFDHVLERIHAGEDLEPTMANTIVEITGKCWTSLGDPSKLESHTLVTITHRYFEWVAVLSSLVEALRNKAFDNLGSLDSALERSIFFGERIVALDFKLSLDKDFEELAENVLKVCLELQPHSKRSYVSLIKIHNRLLEKVDDPILRQTHVAALVHSMGRDIDHALSSEAEQNWKFVAFLVKRVDFVSSKCNFLSDDSQFIGTVAKLYALRLDSDHPLRKLVEKISLWKLVDVEGLTMIRNENLGIGFVLLCCDLSERMLGESVDRSKLESCLQQIYRHAAEIVEFMFQRVGPRPVFDHCLHILCAGLECLGDLNIFSEVSPENVSFEQRLLRDEVFRYFGRKEYAVFNATISIISLIEGKSKPYDTEGAVRTIFEKSFEFLPMKTTDPQVPLTRVIPCSPNSALLFSLISDLFFIRPKKTVSIEHFVILASELHEILIANPGNDCLFLSACSLFTYVRDLELEKIQNVTHRAQIVKLKETVSQLSSRGVLNAFGATSLVVFTLGAELPQWLNMKCPSHENFLRSFAEEFDHDKWNSVLQFLRTGDDSPRPTNVYAASKKPSLYPSLPLPPSCSPYPVNLPAVLSTTTSKHTTTVSALLCNIVSLETSSDPLTAEQTGVLKLCRRKLDNIINRAPRS